MNNEKITLNEFIRMFIAVSFLREYKCINLDNLIEYIKFIFQLDDEMFSAFLIEIDKIFAVLVEEGVISQKKDYEYLIGINENYPVMQEIKKQFDYFGRMNKIVSDFIYYSFLENKDDFHLDDPDNFLELGRVYKKI